MRYLRASLLGISQIFFLSNPWTALLLLAALAWGDWLRAAGALAGALVSTGTAYLLHYRTEAVAQGLYGFNGALVAMAVPYFLGAGGDLDVLWSMMLLGAALSTILVGAFERFLGPHAIPGSTGPFVLTAWLLLMTEFAFTRIHRHPTTTQLVAEHLPVFPEAGAPITLATLGLGFLHGFGQVVLMDNLVSSALALLAIFVGSWRGGIMAVIGSAIGVLVPALLKANEEVIRFGIFAFNPILTAMAFGAIFLPFRGRSILFACTAAVATLIAGAAITVVTGLFGLPGLTAPFVFTFYLFLAAVPHGSDLRRATEPAPQS